MAFRLKQPSVLPGFGLTMGFTLLYLSLIVLIPLGAMVLKTTQLSFADFWAIVTDARILASYWVSFAASFVGATINVVFGFAVAWTLVRYSFPGKRFIDAMVDLPFAMPTAVSGIALTTIYARTGWIGQYLEGWQFPWLAWRGFSEGSGGWWPLRLDWFDRVAYSPLGVVVALTFIGLPFVVRTLQPALEDLEPELEEASATLGAHRLQTFRRVIIPVVFPALLTGYALAFARALGEYGSVVFISANIPMKTEITPVLIVAKLEQYNYAGATAVAVMMLLASFAVLLFINGVQWHVARRKGR